MPDDPLPYWHAMTARDLERVAEDDPVVVQPLAAIEQHGPHLPLSTDVDIGLGILARALETLDDAVPVWVLPPQTVGASLEHARVAGTLTVPATHLTDTICRLGEAVARCGVRRLVLSNSHGGNHAAATEAALRLRDDQALLVVTASYGRFARPDDMLPDAEWRHGIHGGAVETAMMLHLHPERVRVDEVRRFPSLGEELEQGGSRLGPAGPAPFAWLARDLNSTGAVGDATLATADLGRQLVDHYGRRLAAVIRDTRAFPIDRLE